MDSVLLEDRVSLFDQPLFFARMRLFDDRLELSGWSWMKRTSKTIALEDVVDVVWWTGADDCNLELRLADNAHLGLWVKRAAQWKFAIASRANIPTQAAAPLPVDSASTSMAA